MAKDKINVEVRLQNVAVDVHPVVSFEKYLEIFGKELDKEKSQRGFHYPKFESDLKFRLSQRLVLSFRELNCKVFICQESSHKSVGTNIQALSLQALDQQKHALCPHLNPLSLSPGMPTKTDGASSRRAPLFLLEGTPGLSSCTYLESLGFK